MATQIGLLRSAHWAPLGRAPVPLARSMWVWLGLLAFLAAVELFITLVGAGLEQDPRSVLFSWPSLAIFGADRVLEQLFINQVDDSGADGQHLTRQPTEDRRQAGDGVDQGDGQTERLILRCCCGARPAQAAGRRWWCVGSTATVSGSRSGWRPVVANVVSGVRHDRGHAGARSADGG